MKINIFQAGLLAALLLLPACKKDESTTTKPSLSGLSIDTSIPYVRVGDVLSFTADVNSITAADADTQPETIGLAWQVNSASRDTLTRDIRTSNPVFEYTVKEEGSYTVVCYAFAGDDYYATSASTTFQAINPITAMEGMDLQLGTLDLQGRLWTNWNVYESESGRNYEDCEVVASLFGRYYSWEQAQHICPAGWHLPSAQEFDEGLGTDAGALMADASFLEKKMWAYWPEVQITNSLHFNAIPVGYIDAAGADAAKNTLGEYALWWTSSEEDGLGEYRYIVERNPLVQKGLGSKHSLYLNVRCVQDN